MRKKRDMVHITAYDSLYMSHTSVEWLNIIHCVKKNQYLNLFVFDRYFCLKYSNCNALFFPKDELLSPNKSSEIGMNDCKKVNDLKYFVFGHHNLTDEYRCIFNI